MSTAGSGRGEDSDPRAAEAGQVVEAMSSLVQIEAHRRLGEAGIRPDRARLDAGWTYRFVADGERAREVTTLYRELGFEVAADPIFAGQLAEGCEGCALAAALHFSAIYTRRK